MVSDVTDNTARRKYYDLEAFSRYGILIPCTVPIEAVVKMAAAMVSFELDTKSVDYQLKEHRKNLEAVVKPQYVAGPARLR